MTDPQHLTVVVRVVLTRGGRLVLGSVVDLDGAVRGRFVGWARLGAVVRAALVRASVARGRRTLRRTTSPRARLVPFARQTAPGTAPPADDNRL